MPRTAIAEHTENLRQIVIEARGGDIVPGRAELCLDALHGTDPSAFTAEDVRWVNKLRGLLSVRQVARHPDGVTHTRWPKRKGDPLDHCWRCETPIDERFGAVCPDCDSKAYHWLLCPVCGARGCHWATSRLA